MAMQDTTMNKSGWDWDFCQLIQQQPLWYNHGVRREWKYETHHHLGVEFIYCRSGQGSFNFGRHSYPYKAPVLVHFQGAIPHAVRVRGTYERWNLCIEPSSLQLKLQNANQASLNQLLGCASGISFINTTDEYCRRLESLFDTIGNEIDKQQIFYEDIVFYRLQELLTITKRLTGHTGLVGENSTGEITSKWEMEEIVDLLLFIEANLSEDLSAERLAQQFHYSQQHFYRAIRKMTGRSLSEYVKHRRIERAKGLLTATGLSITEIAGSVGLPDPAQFSRAFRALVGCTPSQYRASRE